MHRPDRYHRFPLSYRIEHWVLTVSFTLLALTGLVQLGPQTAIAQWLVGALGGLALVRIIHRAAAVVLLLESVYHLGVVVYRIYVRRAPWTMLPTGRDERVGMQALLHNLGLGKARPAQGRYTFEEKMEYWAVVWGTVVMAVTGFMLWNPIATTRLLPGEFIPAAKAVHEAEAVLAVLAILVWHIYHVHVRSFNRSMFDGTLSMHEMETEHPLELAAAQTEQGRRVASRRPRLFWSLYTAFAVLALVLLYIFVTFEETAIATVPPAETVDVFVPISQPAVATGVSWPQPLDNWEDGIGEMFQVKCGFCHGGASPVANLDLTQYGSTMLGGETGPAIVPGNADASLLVEQQQAGDHPVQLTSSELEQVVTWIQEGAPRI